MATRLVAFHGTKAGAPLLGGQDPVSHRVLRCLWASNSYFLAAQFQDGEVRKLAIELKCPCIISPEEYAERRSRGASGHAAVVDQLLADIEAGRAFWDAVIFPDTVDGMECGDVIAVFPKTDPFGQDIPAAGITLLGTRFYDDDLEDWVSGPGFGDDPFAFELPHAWDLTPFLLTGIST